MKNMLSLLALLIYLVNSGHAQPVISETIIPSFQDSIHLIKCAPSDFQEALVGPDQTWDFSDLQADPTNPEYYFKFFAPQNTPHADRYPQAELAAINADSQWIYYSLANNLIELTGVVFEDPDLGTAFGDYANLETEEVFPIEYENSWSDEFNGMNVLGVFNTAFNGTVNGEVDAYGTLVLPSGTFTNVLRIKEERTYIIPGAPVMTSMMFRYVSAESRLWLLSMESFPTNPPLIYYQDNPEIISATNDLDFSAELKVIPNPVKSGSNLQLFIKDHEVLSLGIYDAIGRAIKIKTDNHESKYLNIPAALTPGVYFVNGTLKNGFFSKRIIVIE